MGTQLVVPIAMASEEDSTGSAEEKMNKKTFPRLEDHL